MSEDEDAADERPPWLAALQDLYQSRGRRLRPLAQQAGMSHQSVNEYLHGARKPPLDKYLGLVRAMGGDEDVFADLWREARREVPPATPLDRELLADILAELRAIRVAVERDANEPPEAQ